MIRAMKNTGWKVLAAQPSAATGGLRVQGINYETTVEIDREFRWDITSLSDPNRFDFTEAVFAPGALPILARMLAAKS